MAGNVKRRSIECWNGEAIRDRFVSGVAKGWQYCRRM
jgi:hypothetical protein